MLVLTDEIDSRAELVQAVRNIQLLAARGAEGAELLILLVTKALSSGIDLRGVIGHDELTGNELAAPVIELAKVLVALAEEPDGAR
jgi:hypothetical protein